MATTSESITTDLLTKKKIEDKILSSLTSIKVTNNPKLTINGTKFNKFKIYSYEDTSDNYSFETKGTVLKGGSYKELYEFYLISSGEKKEIEDKLLILIKPEYGFRKITLELLGIEIQKELSLQCSAIPKVYEYGVYSASEIKIDQSTLDLLKKNNIIGGYIIMEKIIGCDLEDVIKFLTMKCSSNTYAEYSETLYGVNGQEIKVPPNLFKSKSGILDVDKKHVGYQFFNEIIQNDSEDEKINKLVDIFKQILEAINVLHKNLLLHLDIKLENILITYLKESKKFKIYLIDFGYTQVFGNTLRTGGTFGYMSKTISSIMVYNWYESGQHIFIKHLLKYTKKYYEQRSEDKVKIGIKSLKTNYESITTQLPKKNRLHFKDDIYSLGIVFIILSFYVLDLYPYYHDNMWFNYEDYIRRNIDHFLATSTEEPEHLDIKNKLVNQKLKNIGEIIKCMITNTITPTNGNYIDKIISLLNDLDNTDLQFGGFVFSKKLNTNTSSNIYNDLKGFKLQEKMVMFNNYYLSNNKDKQIKINSILPFAMRAMKNISEIENKKHNHKSKKVESFNYNKSINLISLNDVDIGKIITGGIITNEKRLNIIFKRIYSQTSSTSKPVTSPYFSPENLLLGLSSGYYSKYNSNYKTKKNKININNKYKSIKINKDINMNKKKSKHNENIKHKTKKKNKSRTITRKKNKPRTITKEKPRTITRKKKKENKKNNKNKNNKNKLTLKQSRELFFGGASNDKNTTYFACMRCGKIPSIRGKRNFMIPIIDKKTKVEKNLCKNCFVKQFLYVETPTVAIPTPKDILSKFINNEGTTKFKKENGTILTGEEIMDKYIPIVITPWSGIMTDKFHIHFRKPYYDKNEKKIKLKYTDKKIQRAIRFRRVLKKVRKLINANIETNNNVVESPVYSKKKFITIVDNNFTLSVIKPTLKPFQIKKV